MHKAPEVNKMKTSFTCGTLHVLIIDIVGIL